MARTEIVKRDIVFSSLTLEERQRVINAYRLTKTLKELKQLREAHNKDINLRAGDIEDPDLTNMVINEQGYCCFPGDVNWQFMLEGESIRGLFTKVIEECEGFYEDLEALVNGGTTLEGQLSKDITTEIEG